MCSRVQFMQALHGSRWGWPNLRCQVHGTASRVATILLRVEHAVIAVCGRFVQALHGDELVVVKKDAFVVCGISHVVDSRDEAHLAQTPM